MYYKAAIFPTAEVAREATLPLIEQFDELGSSIRIAVINYHGALVIAYSPLDWQSIPMTQRHRVELLLAGAPAVKHIPDLFLDWLVKRDLSGEYRIKEDSEAAKLLPAIWPHAVEWGAEGKDSPLPTPAQPTPMPVQSPWPAHVRVSGKPRRIPLIEAVITHERLLSERPVTGDIKERMYHLQASLALAHTPGKFIWRPSGVAMAAYLMPPLAEEHLHGKVPYPVMISDQDHLFHEFAPPVECAEGLVAGVYLITTSERTSFLDAARSLGYSKAQIKVLTDAIETASHSHYCVITSVDVWGNPLFSVGFEQIGALEVSWKPLPWWKCLTSTCTITRGSDPANPNKVFLEICDTCAHALGHWVGFLSTSLRMLGGEFQEEEEEREEEIMEVRALRKEPRPDKPHKFHEVDITHRFHVVRFDASLKKHSRAGEPQNPRGSWVDAARAIDPQSVQWIPKKIKPYARKLKSIYWEKYNKRGLTIDVKGHGKRIPVTAEYVRLHFTQVEASKFEEGVKK